MKKFLYLIAFVVVTTIATSCTEENITPQSDANGNAELIKL
jgi:hypothetical protein